MLFILIIIVTIIFGCGCNGQSIAPDNLTENKMYVYSNSGNTFYLLDYKTYEVVKEIKLPISDTVSYDGMTISTNRDYLFFGAQGRFPDPPTGFAVYNIKKEKLENLFFTNLNYGIGYFIAAEINVEPGLIFSHFRDYGTYSIDLFDQKVKELISDEHNFDLDKRIFHSSDEQWTVVHKKWNVIESFSELEFYAKNSNLHNLYFVLNPENKDSISIYDFEFSRDNRLFITYQLSGGRSRDIESYFGSYDLETKQLYRSPLIFPWSLNPYYTAYSSSRNEIYTIGAYDKFYIINTDTYEIKDTVILAGKFPGSSQIQITPDENIAFVSCPNSNSIFIIDLNDKKVIKTIAVNEPYNMIIP